MTDVLKRYEENDPGLNGFLISYLINLEADESAKTMRKAFLANRVDESILDWEYVTRTLDLPPTFTPAELKRRSRRNRR